MRVAAIAVAVMCAGWFAGAAQAALMSFNDTNYGASADGFNITRDTSTGLDWLDVDVSVGLTFAQVSAEFGAGGLFEGFRYATKPDLSRDSIGLSSLYASADLSNLSFSFIAGYPKVRDLLALVGCLRPDGHRCNSGYGYLTATMLLDSVTPLLFNTPTDTFLEAFIGGGANFGGSGIIGMSGYTPRNPNPMENVLRGNWLVRDTISAVPLPAALPLFLSALAGLGFVGWRRRQADA